MYKYVPDHHCYFVPISVKAHDGDDDKLTPEHVEATHKFARSCNKRSVSSCVLQSEVTEGPYYYDTQLIRQNITEGYQGLPMILNIAVVDVNTCEPIVGAAVDLWHCNSLGVYSHYQVSNNAGGSNTTFLRGIQLTDSNGNVSFHSIFPGWYQPRVIHLHVKVHLGGSSASSGYNGGDVVHTGQMFVSDEFASQLSSISPYSSNRQSLNTLSSDSIYSEAGSIALMDISYSSLSEGVYASITLGVNSASTTASSAVSAASSTASPASSISSSTANTNNGESSPSSSASYISYSQFFSAPIFVIFVILSVA